MNNIIYNRIHKIQNELTVAQKMRLKIKNQCFACSNLFAGAIVVMLVC